MLVLSRRTSESIVIDDRIVITIVEVRGDKVRLGIEAPRDVPVHRQEVYVAIKAEQDRLTQPEQPDNALPASPPAEG
ncbi:MAG: carbon storage regulator CsrA [Planctomycetaceae bacterium]|nr:carbon storage regulator CsrA [Planctomycetaceae bacterium]